MKHKHSISCLLAAAAAAAMACSCTKEDAARFEGDYSFKTSGTLTISADGTDGTGEGTPQTVSLVPESGSAEKFTDVVLFSLEYSGTATIGDTVYPIIASDVDCVAHEND